MARLCTAEVPIFFIDTMVICSCTAFMILLSDVYQPGADIDGVVLTQQALSSHFGDWASYFLSLAVLLFAFSTMISWSYYGERCWVFLFGAGSSVIYRVIFVCFVVLGSILKLGSALDFSDLMILGMAFPNILGVLLLSGKIKADLDDYWKRYKSGEFEAAETQNKG